MLEFRVRGSDEVREKLRRLSTAIPSEARDGLHRGLLHLQAEVVRLLSNKVLKRRTGHLAGSINTRVQQDGRNARGFVGTPEVYAPTHEYGATIKPVRAKFLAIPRADNLTGAGVQRFTPRQRPDMFIYVKSVKIPERPYLRRGLAEHQARINEYVEQGVRRQIARTQGGQL